MSVKKHIIHDTAIVEDRENIDEGSVIGPFCVVGKNAKLGKRVKLHSHVVIAGNTIIGDDTEIWPFASIGHQPQDLKYQGELSDLVIGARNKIRESVSINPGTEGGGGITKIGNDCLFMLGSHIGHDCTIGNSVVIANNSAIAGHVIIGDNVTIGGLSGIHQFCRLGEGSMVGALSMVTNDIVPYSLVVGERPKLSGLNLIGLKRRGVTVKKIRDLKRFYNQLFNSSENFKMQAELILEAGTTNEYEEKILEFILSDSNRSFLTPKN